MPRILTYNVHRCVGPDRRLDIGRVADAIAACEPDIVALQELDVGRPRTGGLDQAHEIAQRLGMSFHFNAALRVEEEQYGDAILTLLPERLVKAGPLPGLDPRVPLEPRGALWVEVTVDGRPLQVINTHLGLAPGEQQRQARALAGDAWLGHPERRDPVILLGDFNAGPASIVHRTLSRRLTDARRLTHHRRRTPTFPSHLPLLRIDHVFVSHGIRVLQLDAPFTVQTRMASDHLPLVMAFELQ
ncbi:endonuclease/exonuclease/phosphatase family protein [Phenylobacterium montanum]|uniref:Endonuclease/exonuclease/phosphatase family protein n=2 Tax=Phenylobacterium montanum TaxID=2823693 RepID=A0A975G609_9CAUL|nr:endonuclease/exonuclease/phosphatase family protein [Caulobacter sp. S6]QUD90701.1 endonuclease/exonuclease/phosphatase family protein [Caulobacter sp. S6]